MLVGTEAEVLDGLTGVLGATEKEGVGTGGLLEGKLIQGDGLAASGLKTAAGSGGEAQSRNGDLGDLQQTVVIGDGTDDDNGALLLLSGVGYDAGQGHGGAVLVYLVRCGIFFLE